MISEAQFRKDLPEFTDPAVYTPYGINFWLNIAKQSINTHRWGGSAHDPWPTVLLDLPDLTLYDLGTELFIAHQLVLEARANAVVAAGGIPGEVSGPVSSKSVDKVSVSYDVQAIIEAGAGYWNLTTYGLRYFRMMMLAGMGAVQIGIGRIPPNTLAGWPGPFGGSY